MKNHIVALVGAIIGWSVGIIIGTGLLDHNQTWPVFWWALILGIEFTFAGALIGSAASVLIIGYDE